MFFIFCPPHIKKKNFYRLTFGTLPIARHTSHFFAKVKEPNFANTPQNIELKFEVE